METIRITDMTLPECMSIPAVSLSFKERLEIAKCLGRLSPDVLELPALENKTADALLVRTISTTVRGCGVSMPAGLTAGEADEAWAAIAKAERPRLRVEVPLSTVQMEYLLRKKPKAVLETAEKQLSYCKSLCPDLDFCAGDATRADAPFLREAIRMAIRCGATTITLCDSAGVMLPAELAEFITSLKQDVPELADVGIAVRCTDELSMAAACAMAAIAAGAREVKASLVGEKPLSLPAFAHVLALRGDELGFRSGVSTMEMQRLQKQVNWIVFSRQGNSPFSAGLRGLSEEGPALSIHDDKAAVAAVAAKLGYDLSGEDLDAVDEAFRAAAANKDLSERELEAIISSVALQVPPTYTLKGFVINSGSQMRATAHVALMKEGKELRGLSAGDGPIDAAFLAIEQVAGTHYELDDFQIQAVTEGREAMGSAFVKLRSGSQLYSGSGISTDIIEAAIHAYVSALNKIAYEEAGQ